MADVVIPLEYGMSKEEKLTIARSICTPLLKKIQADLQRNIDDENENTVEEDDSVNRQVYLSNYVILFQIY